MRASRGQVESSKKAFWFGGVHLARRAPEREDRPRDFVGAVDDELENRRSSRRAASERERAEDEDVLAHRHVQLEVPKVTVPADAVDEGLTDRGAHGEAHGGADERAHWACARPSSGVFNLTSTTHTPVRGVLSRARARLCLAGRGIGPILVRVFKCKLILPGGTWEHWAPSPPSTKIRQW